jgi:hypothetical protein
VSQNQTVTPAQAYHDYYGPAIFEPLTRHVVVVPMHTNIAVAHTSPVTIEGHDRDG